MTMTNQKPFIAGNWKLFMTSSEAVELVSALHEECDVFEDAQMVVFPPFTALCDVQITLQGSPGDLVSLLPIGGDASGVTTTGLAWALQNDRLRFGFSRGVSNEMTAREAQIEVAQGLLLVVHGPAPEG